MNFDEIENVIVGMYKILEEIPNYSAMGVVSKMYYILNNDRDKFCKYAISSDIWGSAGSLCDMALVGLKAEEYDTARFKDLAHRFSVAMRRFSFLVSEGKIHPAMNSWVEFYNGLLWYMNILFFQIV